MNKRLIVLLLAIVLFALILFLGHSSASLCYQDNTNRSSSNDGTCGLNYTGFYNMSTDIYGSWNTPYKLIDNDTSTYSVCGADFGLTCGWQETYVKPTDYNNTAYFFLQDDNPRYITILPSCKNYNPTNITFRITYKNAKLSQPSNDYVDCYNGTWVNIYTNPSPSPTNVYEAGIYWFIPSNMNDTNLTINEPSGLYSDTQNVPINVSIFNITGIDKCWFNITKNNLANTLEVPNTYFNCNYTTTQVTDISSYKANICINYTNTDKYCSSSVFFFNTIISQIINNGGSGGGINPIIQPVNETLAPNLEDNLFGWLSTSAFIVKGLNITRFVLIASVMAIFILLYNLRHGRKR